MSRNRNRKGGGVKRVRHDDWMADIRDVSTLYNKQFELYYRGNVVPESEWAVFMQTMQTSLPLALRVNRAHAHAAQITSLVKDSLSRVFNTRPLPFYPSAAAMQCQASRADLKRNAELKSLKRLIAALNEGGFLTRQEAVSMLPPLLLQLRPGLRILDLCAAPGSKTSQLLEALLPVPKSGVVVANDLNASRLDVLHHQTNRLAGAHAHLILTNYDAAHFPLLPYEHRFDCVLCDVMCSGDGTLRKSIDMWPRWNSVQGADLHRTQCAVLMRGMASCRTGGLLVYSTCSLNPVENEAVVSECLSQVNPQSDDDEEEGKVHDAAGCAVTSAVHSTVRADECSRVHADGMTAKGKSTRCRFRLLDAQSLLPGLLSSPGMTRWSITTKDGSTRLYSFAEAQAHRHNLSSDAAASASTGARTTMDEEGTQRRVFTRRPSGFRYVESMFAHPDRLQAQHIHYTRRVLPHQQDTGGFYIAVMLCERALEETCVRQDNHSGTDNSSRRRRRSSSSTQAGNTTVVGDGIGKAAKDATTVTSAPDPPPDSSLTAATTSAAVALSLSPFKTLSQELRHTVQRAFGLPSSFPYGNLLVRNEQAREQKIYYANTDTIELSYRLGGRVVHVGAKVMESFVKCSNDKLRLCADGVSCIAPLLEHSSSDEQDTSLHEDKVQGDITSLNARESLPLNDSNSGGNSNSTKTALRSLNAIHLSAGDDFVVPVQPELLLRAAQLKPPSLHYDEFTRLANRTLDSLPFPSCVLHCRHPSLGSMYIAAEQSTKHGVMMIHVVEWQLTLCRHALQLPLVAHVGNDDVVAAHASAQDETEETEDGMCLS